MNLKKKSMEAWKGFKEAHKLHQDTINYCEELFSINQVMIALNWGMINKFEELKIDNIEGRKIEDIKQELKKEKKFKPTWKRIKKSFFDMTEMREHNQALKHLAEKGLRILEKNNIKFFYYKFQGKRVAIIKEELKDLKMMEKNGQFV